jgi:succinoglycan biosynthesis protein ExoL
MADAPQPRVALFVHDLADSGTTKRAEQLLEQGCAVHVLGFRRFRYNLDRVPPWPHVTLGRTSDGRYWQRILAMTAALRVLYRNRNRLRDADVLYARNIDQLLLALAADGLFGLRKRIVYEVLDVQPIMARPGAFPRFLRAVERLCLSKIGLLVVSSPAFHRSYYDPVQHYTGPWYLLENKLRNSAATLLERPRPNRGSDDTWRRGYRWVVAYYGLIRGQATFDLIVRLAERLQDTVLFKFRGILTTVDEGSFRAALRRLPNLVYEGDYAIPRDLPELYGSADFVWALDLENVESNSRWLLPCRFYEAGLFGVPCLAVKGFEFGDMVERLDVGWTFATPFEDAIAGFLETLSLARYESVRQKLLALPRSTFLQGEDIGGLCRAILPAQPATAGQTGGGTATPFPAGGARRPGARAR